MEDIYAASNKVLVDSGSNSNLLYLPVDKILEQRRNSLATPALRDSAPPTVVKPAATAAPRDPADLRTRGAR
jgi:membrane protease subunit HflK